MIDSIAAHILDLPVWLALVLVFALPALESSAFLGFVFPGEIALILGGVLSSEHKVALAAVLAAGIAGAVVGDSVGYLVGRRYGRGLLDGTLGRFINHRHLDRAESYLAERGGKAVFLGRFTAALRVMIPGLAGMSRMHYPRFAAFNIAGGLAWGSLCVILGYLAGNSWRTVAHAASRVGLAALGLVVLAAVVGYVVHRARHRSQKSDRLEQRTSATETSLSASTRRLADRYPRTASWTWARVDPSSTAGLPLTLSLGVLVAATWMFLGISQDVVAREELAGIDLPVHSWMLAHRTGFLTTTLRAATWLGSSAVLIPLLLGVGLYLRRAWGSWRPLINNVTVYVAALLGHAVVARLVHRSRPPHSDWLAHAAGWSYPSGHTIQAAAAYGVLMLVLAPRATRAARTVLITIAVLLVTLVGVSRVYLGVHWPTDVLGSVTLAVALLALWTTIRLRALSHREA